MHETATKKKHRPHARQAPPIRACVEERDGQLIMPRAGARQYQNNTVVNSKLKKVREQRRLTESAVSFLDTIGEVILVDGVEDFRKFFPGRFSILP